MVVKRTTINGHWTTNVTGSSTSNVSRKLLDGVMSSFDNPGFPRFLGKFDVGRGWQCVKYEATYNGFDWTLPGGRYGKMTVTPLNNASLTFTGGSTGANGTLPTISESSGKPSGSPSRLTNLQRADYGTRAINYTMPTRPHFDLAAALHEAAIDASFLPTLSVLKSKEFGGIPSNLGSDYLAYNFGTAPTISDLQGLAEAVKSQSDIYSRFERESGKLVRRRMEFPEHSASDSSSDSGATAMGHTSGGPSWSSYSATSTTVRSTTQRTWFSGAFKYYLSPNPFLRHYELIQHQLGSLGPSTVWETIPFSWLIDYFSDYGTVLENLSYIGADGQVMVYGYLMDSWVNEVVRTVNFSGSVLIPGSGTYHLSGSTSTTERIVYKTRMIGYPFGFSVSPPSLTAKQTAILGALGLVLLA